MLMNTKCRIDKLKVSNRDKGAHRLDGALFRERHKLILMGEVRYLLQLDRYIEKSCPGLDGEPL